MNDLEKSENLARHRLMIISLVRFSGVVLIMLGIYTVSGKAAWPDFIGYVLLLLGAVEFFYMPLVLARRWRSMDE